VSYFIIVTVLIFTNTEIFAQNNIGNLMVRNKYKGDQYFLDLYYAQAISYYKLALKKDVNPDLLKLKIGDSYRLLHEYDKAETWYAQVLQTNPEDAKSIYKYHYANTLLTAGKYDEAKEWFNTYKQDVPEDSRPDRKIYGIDRLSLYYIDSTVTKIEHIPINTYYSEVAPVPYKNGIVFLSARDHNALVDHDYLRQEDLYDIFFAAHDSISGWGHAHLFDKVLNTPFHEGPISFYTGEEKLILTRSNYYNKRQTVSTDGKTNLQLYTAVKTGDLWANIQPFQLNDPSYSLAHPALNNTNDTLFFASDMPGGYGGTDLYMSVFSENWSNPINLGPKVNTEGDELFPSYILGRLFFASDGLDGLGGLDVYKAAIENGSVSYVTNMGYPINSPVDDFSYNIDPATMTGYFASNRAGGRGKDDIYSYRQTAQVLTGIVLQVQDETPLEGAQVNLIEDGIMIATTVTAEDGTFRFYLPLSSDFQITAFKEEHILKTDVRISSRGNRVDIDTLLIKMRKQDLFAQGLIYDNETQQTIHNVRVTIRNDITGEEESIVTRTDGFYRFAIEPGNSYTILAKRERFIPDSLQINTLSISKGVILNDFVIEEEFIDKEVILFDYNEYVLQPGAGSILQKTIDVLKRYPNDYVIIGAHADARGTFEYNLELSEKRANTVVEYLVERGISRNQIIARGFGEGLIINRCVDGVNCREEDLSLNRRAEIKVEEDPPEEQFYDRDQR